MNQILFIFGIEGIIAGKIEKGAVHLFKIPGIVKADLMRHHLSLGRNVRDIFSQLFHHAAIQRLVQYLKPIHRQIGMLAQRHTGPPFAPAILPFATSIQLGA